MGESPMKTETRYFKAEVRKEHAQGSFAPRIFELVVTVTGSHHALMDEAIRAIRAEGFETNRIVSHSVMRDCL